MFRVVEVAECNGLSRAGLSAGRNIFMLLNFSFSFSIGSVFCPHEPVVTECAFFNYATHSRRHLWREVAFKAFAFWEVCVPPVKIPGMIWAGGLAVSATYAACIDLAHDPGIDINFCGSGDTHGNTRRVMPAIAVLFAMHTGPWKITDLGMREWFAVRDLK